MVWLRHQHNETAAVTADERAGHAAELAALLPRLPKAKRAEPAWSEVDAGVLGRTLA